MSAILIQMRSECNPFLYKSRVKENIQDSRVSIVFRKPTSQESFFGASFNQDNFQKTYQQYNEGDTISDLRRETSVNTLYKHK